MENPIQEPVRRITQGVERFNGAAAPRLTSSRTVANAAAFLFIVQGFLLMLAPRWAPTPLRAVSNPHAELAVGIAVSLLGAAALVLVNRPGDHARQNWRIGGGLLCTVPFTAGLVLLLWPKQQDLLESHQPLIGVVLVGLSLWAGVFALEGHGLKKTHADNQRLLACLLLLTGFGVGTAFLWEHPSVAGIAVLGLTVLLTTILTANMLATREDRGLVGIRTAITLSIVAMFIGFVGFANDIPLTKGSILHGTMENFWIVLSAVVGSYFGAQAWERVARIQAPKGPA